MAVKSTLVKDAPVINYRPIAFCALSLAVGIVTGAFLRANAVAFYVALSVSLACVIVLAVFKKKTAVAMLAFAVFGATSFVLVFGAVSLKDQTYESAFVSGVVCEVKSYDGDAVYVLDDVFVNGNAVDGNALVYADCTFAVGDEIGVYGSGSTFSYDPFDSYSSNYYYNDIRHKFDAVTAVNTGQGKVSIFAMLRAKIGKLYVENMGERAGGLALGMVIGDKSRMDKAVGLAMREGGIAHLTAVSGLHVGFMCSIIFFVFRLFRRSKRSSITAVAVVLLLYGGITGFPPGVVRAGVMTLVVLAALCFGERYDPLNGLSTAVIVILIANPRELFSLSFVMSVTAVLGIVCFYRPIRRLLYKGRKKTVGRLADAVALSVSANVYLVAVSACAFNEFPTYFLLTNPIAVAYSSVVYSMLVPVTLISMIPSMGFLLVPFKYLMLGLYGFANAVSELPCATVGITSNAVSALLYACAVTLLSGFIRLKNRAKAVGSSVLFALSILFLYII